MRFKEKVVLVTGASKGIGRATALEFSKEGAKVIVNYLNSEKEANDVVDEIKETGAEALAVKCDVSDEEQVKEMMKTVVDRFGRIDVLVNNAGMVFDVPFEERTVDHWKRTLEVNLIGTFICSKAAAKHMTNGRIVNISSIDAIKTISPDSMDYGASKAGIVSLTRTMAKELAPNILVNAVAPGWVDTDMNKDLPQDYVKEETERVYVKRWGKPEEIAKAVLFLASEDASYITAETLVVDGGYD